MKVRLHLRVYSKVSQAELRVNAPKEIFQSLEQSTEYFSHRGPESFWSNNASIEDWFDEFVGQANIINRFGGIKMEDLWGELLVTTCYISWNHRL